MSRRKYLGCAGRSGGESGLKKLGGSYNCKSAAGEAPKEINEEVWSAKGEGLKPSRVASSRPGGEQECGQQFQIKQRSLVRGGLRVSLAVATQRSLVATLT